MNNASPNDYIKICNIYSCKKCLGKSFEPIHTKNFETTNYFKSKNNTVSNNTKNKNKNSNLEEPFYAKKFKTIMLSPFLELKQSPKFLFPLKSDTLLPKLSILPDFYSLKKAKRLPNDITTSNRELTKI